MQGLCLDLNMDKPLKTSASGRTCAFPRCTHVLSIYNHEAYCHIHRSQIAEAQRPKTSADPDHLPLAVPK